MLRFNVKGMTCGHCVRAITAVVERVAPGAVVNIDLKIGEVTIARDQALDAEKLAQAITEEGYHVASLV